MQLNRQGHPKPRYPTLRPSGCTKLNQVYGHPYTDFSSKGDPSFLSQSQRFVEKVHRAGVT